MRGKHVEVHDWPGDSQKKELVDALLLFDPKHDSSVRSWSQLKKKMPDLHKIFTTHCR